jgi:hypothetical protein
MEPEYCTEPEASEEGVPRAGRGRGGGGEGHGLMLTGGVALPEAAAEEVEGMPNGARLALLTLALEELFPLPLPLPLLMLGSAWNLVPQRTIPSRAMKSVKKLVEVALLVVVDQQRMDFLWKR